MKHLNVNHPQFSKKYDDYVEKFNNLSEMMDKAGLDVRLLREVVMATQAVERLDETNGEATDVSEQENKVDHVYISLSETTFRYHLLHDLSSILFALHADDIYTKEDAMEELMKVIRVIQVDIPNLPMGEIAPSGTR